MRAHQPAKVYLEPDEVASLEKSASNLRDVLLIRLLFHLGCRVSEALAIAVDDIDIPSCTVTIQHLKTRINITCPRCGARLGRSHTYCPKCGVKVEEAVSRELEHRKMRTLPLDRDTSQMLRDYIRRGGPVKREGKMLIFGIGRHRAWQIIGECAERAKLPKLANTETGKVHNISPHRLRDAFAIHAMKLNDTGEGLRLLQEHLGHANFNTTARYRKVSGSEHRDWYEKLWGTGDNAIMIGAKTESRVPGGEANAESNLIEKTAILKTNKERESNPLRSRNEHKKRGSRLKPKPQAEKMEPGNRPYAEHYPESLQEVQA